MSLMLLQQILVMAIFILFGFLGVKFHILNKDDSPRLASLVLYIICPALIFDSFQIAFSLDKMYGLLLAVLASALMHILFLGVTAAFGKVFSFDKIEKDSAIYSNCGNLIVPLIGAILGKEYVLYCCAFMSVQTIMLWTHGVYILGGRAAVNPKKVISNPSIIAMLSGLVFFFSGLRLPAIPATAITMTGDCIAPISMIVIGILIACADPRKLFLDARAWLVCILRLIIIPLLTIALLYISRIPFLMEEGPRILYVSFLASAAPTAVNVTQLSDIYGEDSVRAGSINILSVFLCIVTMPLMTAIYQYVFHLS